MGLYDAGMKRAMKSQQRLCVNISKHDLPKHDAGNCHLWTSEDRKRKLRDCGAKVEESGIDEKGGNGSDCL